jgi:hypothetical protein
VCAVNTDLLYRRRAERFSQLLGESTGTRPPVHSRSSADAELGELVTFSHHVIAAAPDVRMDPSKKTELRAFIMATAVRDGIGVNARTTAEPVVGRARVRGARDTATDTPRPRRSARTKVAVLVGVAVGTLALSGISAASGDAMPGDPLYGLKRSQEHAQLAIASGPTAKAKLDLDFAYIRLGEAEAIRANAHQLGATLTDMDGSTDEGVQLLFKQAIKTHSTSPLGTVDAFLARQDDGLHTLLGGVVGADKGRVNGSITKVEVLQLRSATIRNAMNTCPDTVAPTTDPLGVNASCPETTRVNTPSPTPRTSGGTGKGGKTPGHDQNVTPDGNPDGVATNPAPGATVGGGLTVDGGTATPSPSDTTGGLLGDIGHVLGGLLGH